MPFSQTLHSAFFAVLKTGHTSKLPPLTRNTGHSRRTPTHICMSPTPKNPSQKKRFPKNFNTDVLASLYCLSLYLFAEPIESSTVSRLCDRISLFYQIDIEKKVDAGP